MNKVQRIFGFRHCFSSVGSELEMLPVQMLLILQKSLAALRFHY